MNTAKKTKPSVSAVLAHMAENHLRQGNINSYYRYRSAMHAFERCDSGLVPISAVSKQWLEERERDLREQGLSYTTINIYMKALKAALRNRLPNARLPFGRGKYELPTPSVRKLALSKSQIHTIINYKGSKAEEYYRDLWVFSYLCNGINFRDLIFLRQSDLRNGEVWYIRSKTRRSNTQPRVIRAAITQEMKEIIRRCGKKKHKGPDDYIFPFAKPGMTAMEINNLTKKITRLCNRYLDVIAKKTGLPHFTTYSARHSFATVLLRSGVDIEYISECLGHSSLEITRIYLAGFDQSTRMKNARKLL